MYNLDSAVNLFQMDNLKELSIMARSTTDSIFGQKIYLRGLIEFSNYCTSNCLYCGIRRDNGKIHRYRLTRKEIIMAVRMGFKRGIRTFVLQGGEDPWFTVDRMSEIISSIKTETGGGAALTLSCGMLPIEAYREFRSAGADRYLIRFETSDEKLHVHLRDGFTLEERIEAIENLRSLGFQVGSGFMVGLPGETDETVVNNVLLCRKLHLDMAGIGPFIPHPDTPLAKASQIPLHLTLKATALLRIATPKAHIPATTAAGSLVPDGREQMISCGANVVMPNLTPVTVKKDYLLYPGKICLDEDGIKCIGCLGLRIKTTGKEMSFSRADGLVNNTGSLTSSHSTL